MMPDERNRGDGGDYAFIPYCSSSARRASSRALTAYPVRTIILVLLVCCVAGLQTQAANEPLIPTPLNSLLLEIRPGMTTNQVVGVLSPSYSKVIARMSEWSGQTGYIDYNLDERFTLSISSITRGGKEVAHDDLLVYVFDCKSKRRVEIRLFYSKGQVNKKTATNK